MAVVFSRATFVVYRYVPIVHRHSVTATA